MTSPYHSQPRRLMRDPSNKLIGGVCSGLAKYLNMDVNLVRILTVVISLFTGVPIVLYLIALFLLPEERRDPQPPHVNAPPSAYGSGYGGQTYQQPTYGSAPQQPADDVWGAGGAPWEQPHSASPVSAPGHAPSQPSWPQPPASSFGAAETSPGTESSPTSYDTAPVTPDPEAPATSAPEENSAAVPDTEPVPETDAPRAAESGSSTWESAPADPRAEDTKKD